MIPILEIQSVNKSAVTALNVIGKSEQNNKRLGKLRQTKEGGMRRAKRV